MGARENQLSRWGAISKIIPHANPQAKVFFVGDSDDTGFQNFVQEFPPDKDGEVRVYGSIFDSTMLANAKAGRGDVVLVMPGHSENITTDKSLNVRGLKVIGLGEGDERPKIIYDNAAGSISLDTGGIHFENFRLIASVTAVTIGMDVVGDGCVVRRNSLEFDTNADDFAIGIKVTGDRGIVDDNEILGEDTVGPTHGILLNGSDFSKVRRNFIMGQFTVAGIRMDSDAGLGGLIEDNKVWNQDTAASIPISIVAAAKPMVVNNRLATSDSTAGGLSAAAPGGGRWLENYITDGDSASGVLAPAVSSS